MALQRAPCFFSHDQVRGELLRMDTHSVAYESYAPFNVEGGWLQIMYSPLYSRVDGLDQPRHVRSLGTTGDLPR
jgi:hypothetical protein